jgi:radical SAM superfamily enzyme YgiQ (UPF0313 family)
MSVAALRLRDGRAACLSLRPDATALSVDETRVASFDLAGRPYAVSREGWTWRRALDGRLLEKGSDGPGTPRLRRVIQAKDGAPLLEAARDDASAILAALDEGASLPTALQQQARRRLARIVAMDAEALASDAARFAATYRRVGILPPDQYLAVVLEATEGCAWNACTFCDFYQGVRFWAKTPSEFDEHLAAVAAFFGDALPLRRSVFLGAANALCASHERVLSWIAAAARAFPDQVAAGGVRAFTDTWSGAAKGADCYREYAALGLRRVYVGLESGDRELLRFLNKPSRPEDATALVAALHAAGLDVGVILLLGIGGERFFAAHVRASAALLRALALRQHDLLYFSEFAPSPGAGYERRVDGPDLLPLPAARCAEQRDAILDGLRLGPDGPRVATYDVREFVY